MDSIYLALGVNPDGTALIIRPINPKGKNGFPFHHMLCDIEGMGFDYASDLFGRIMISAIGAFHPKVDDFELLPDLPKKVVFPTNPPADQIGKGDMRALRMGLGFGADETGPALLVGAYDGEVPLGEASTQSLALLHDVGPGVAPAVIGDMMLRRLAVMNPDVLRPLFPTLALGEA
jgi:hypothetical protein